MSHVMCHLSHVTCHMLRVMCQMKKKFLIFLSGLASWWRVCYQRGYPSRFYFVNQFTLYDHLEVVFYVAILHMGVSDVPGGMTLSDIPQAGATLQLS